MAEEGKLSKTGQKKRYFSKKGKKSRISRLIHPERAFFKKLRNIIYQKINRKEKEK